MNQYTDPEIVERVILDRGDQPIRCYKYGGKLGRIVADGGGKISSEEWPDEFPDLFFRMNGRGSNSFTARIRPVSSRKSTETIELDDGDFYHPENQFPYDGLVRRVSTERNPRGLAMPWIIPEDEHQQWMDMTNGNVMLMLEMVAGGVLPSRYALIEKVRPPLRDWKIIRRVNLGIELLRETESFIQDQLPDMKSRAMMTVGATPTATYYYNSLNDENLVEILNRAGRMRILAASRRSSSNITPVQSRVDSVLIAYHISMIVGCLTGRDPFDQFCADIFYASSRPLFFALSEHKLQQMKAIIVDTIEGISENRRKPRIEQIVGSIINLKSHCDRNNMTWGGLRNLTNAFYDMDSARFEITDEATDLITDDDAARRFFEAVRSSEMREGKYRWTTPSHDVIKMLNDGVPPDWVLSVCTERA